MIFADLPPAVTTHDLPAGQTFADLEAPVGESSTDVYIILWDDVTLILWDNNDPINWDNTDGFVNVHDVR